MARLKRYFDGITALNVTVDLQNPALPAVEIVASAEHFHDLVSREHSGQLWRSVDGAVQKLEQEYAGAHPELASAFQEWVTSQTAILWCDTSPSMRYRCSTAPRRCWP